MTQASNHEALYDELTAKYGAVHMIVHKGEVFAWRAPEPEVFEAYQEKLTRNTATVGVAYRELCNRSLVHGDEAKMTAFFRQYPAMPTTIGDQLIAFARAEVLVIVKKG